MRKITYVVMAFAAVSQWVSAAKDVPMRGRVYVVAPLTLAHDAADILDFGTLGKGSGASVIQVQAASNAIPEVIGGGDATVLSHASSSAAKFTVGGEVGKSYTITLPADNQIYLLSGTNKLYLTAFTCSKPTGGTATIGSPTENVFWVGANLQLPSNAASGTYEADFPVTVAYY
jgi:hypothetical protein